MPSEAKRRQRDLKRVWRYALDEAGGAEERANINHAFAKIHNDLFVAATGGERPPESDPGVELSDVERFMAALATMSESRVDRARYRAADATLGAAMAVYNVLVPEYVQAAATDPEGGHAN